MSIHGICLNNLSSNAQSPLAKYKEYKSIFVWIKQLLIYCQSCDKIIDGSVIKLGNSIEGIIICNYCLYETQNKDISNRKIN